MVLVVGAAFDRRNVSGVFLTACAAVLAGSGSMDHSFGMMRAG